MFLSFDGVDGAGKTTQLDLFCARLKQTGYDLVRCRDPGTTPLGEEIRKLLLERHSLAISSLSEMLLYMAARAQLVDEIIRPALEAGKTIVSDRYLLANVVYQGHAGGLDPADVWDVGRIATGGLQPDLTIVLDISPDAAAARLNRPLDRMELKGAAFHAAVRDGFLREAARNPEAIAVIDASRSIDQVQADIWTAVTRKLPEVR